MLPPMGCWLLGAARLGELSERSGSLSLDATSRYPLAKVVRQRAPAGFHPGGSLSRSNIRMIATIPSCPMGERTAGPTAFVCLAADSVQSRMTRASVMALSAPQRPRLHGGWEIRNPGLVWGKPRGAEEMPWPENAERGEANGDDTPRYPEASTGRVVASQASLWAAGLALRPAVISAMQVGRRL